MPKDQADVSEGSQRGPAISAGPLSFWLYLMARWSIESPRRDLPVSSQASCPLAPVDFIVYIDQPGGADKLAKRSETRAQFMAAS